MVGGYGFLEVCWVHSSHIHAARGLDGPYFLPDDSVQETSYTLSFLLREARSAQGFCLHKPVLVSEQTDLSPVRYCLRTVNSSMSMEARL